MVSLSEIRASNAMAASLLPNNLVAVFVGATSGIGEATLKKFAEYLGRNNNSNSNPRVYFIGRSQEAGTRIEAECQALNPSGRYTFIKADVSLIRVVDEVCEEIKKTEGYVNLLFLTCGVLSLDRSKTSEDLHLLAALNYYSRMRFITNLLPLLQRAPSPGTNKNNTLRRVITVAGGTLESTLDTSDFPALHVPLEQLRGHLSSLITLGLEAVATSTSYLDAVPGVGVSFVHNYPGTVRTKLTISHLSLQEAKGEGEEEEALRKMGLKFMPIEECAERQFYMATSIRFPPATTTTTTTTTTTAGGKGDGDEKSAIGDGGMLLGDNGVKEVAVGTSGVHGSGVYSLDADCESPSPEVLHLLTEMRERSLVEDVWQHTLSEYRRVTGT